MFQTLYVVQNSKLHKDMVLLSMQVCQDWFQGIQMVKMCGINLLFQKYDTVRIVLKVLGLYTRPVSRNVNITFNFW